MYQLLVKLYHDDRGALIATEFLFVATILVIGVVFGIATVRNSVNAELAEFANAILALSQGYTVSGLSGCSAAVDGSQASDTSALVTNPVNVVPSDPSIIDVLPCN
jgi:hypothetical protein